MAVSPALRSLRRAAVDHAFIGASTLGDAFDRMGFVQADPIRAPARAQDLVLRQRVGGYRAGDLERAYASLPIFEDMLHVYGFVHRRHRGLLHPRRVARVFHVEEAHPHLRRAIVDHLTHAGPSHPRDIDFALASRHGRASIVNAWGGQSHATTQMLDILQYRGVLDVVRRDRGVRVYALREKSIAGEATLSPAKRADGLIALLVNLYAPLPLATMQQLTLMLGRQGIARETLRARVPLLIKRDVIRKTRIEGIDYLSMASDRVVDSPQQSRVRFLAPFDPLVWDRRRFEVLWGWAYRFEAYTPSIKRRFGYYALPLLWDTGDDARVVGWVNVTRSAGRQVDVTAGFHGTRPRGAEFKAAFDAEVAALERFLVSDAVDEAVDPA